MIVLSDTLFNPSVEVVAFTSDREPDCAPWINKNVAPVILLLVLVSFAPEVGVADTIFVTGNSRGDDAAATVPINSIPNIARHVRLWFDIEQ
jgi:hypothetical protein